MSVATKLPVRAVVHVLGVCDAETAFVLGGVVERLEVVVGVLAVIAVGTAVLTLAEVADVFDVDEGAPAVGGGVVV